MIASYLGFNGFMLIFDCDQVSRFDLRYGNFLLDDQIQGAVFILCIIDDAFTVPNFSIIASSRTTRLFSLSVDRSLRLEVMAAEDKSLREKRKDPQH